jgi:hypothetical protein
MSMRRWIAVAMLSAVLLLWTGGLASAEEDDERCFPWPIGCYI